MATNKRLNQKHIQVNSDHALSDARQYFLKILGLNPKNIEAIKNLAFIYLKQNKVDGAEIYLKKFLELNFDIVMLQNLFQVLMVQKKWSELISLGFQQIQQKKYNQHILKIYGVAFREQGLFDNAKNIFDKLISEFPYYIEGYISYGYTLNANYNYTEAIKIFLKGLSLNKNNFELNYNLGLAYNNLKEYRSAAKFLKKASEINPNYFNLWMTLAETYNKLNDYPSSDEAIRHCLRLDPENYLIFLQYASINRARGNIERSEILLDEALSIKPDDIEIHFQMAIIKFMLGKYKEGLNFYKYRVIRNEKYGMFDDFELPKLYKDDHIILAYEQGIGDQLLFFRLMHEFLDKFKYVTYICLDKTYTLFNNYFSQLKVIKESDYQKNIQKYSHGYKKINLGSILNYITDIPQALKQSKNLQPKNYVSKKIKEKIIIGLSWTSSNMKMEGYKNIKLNELLPLLDDQRVNYYSIQYGDIRNELDAINKTLKNKIIHNNKLDLYNNLDSAIELVSECDLVITTSNLNAHLAGTLGIPTLLLTPFGYGRLWYWYESNKNSRSTWYNSVEFLKQDESYSWESAITEAKKKITKLINSI